MEIRFDCHVHTHRSPCGKPDATLQRMADEIRAAGIPRWGYADHLFTDRNVRDLEEARREFDALTDTAGAVFAVEASVLRDWDIRRTAKTGNIWGWHPGGPKGSLELYCPPELVERLGIRYVIAGAHWPLGARMTRKACVRDYHRQNIFLAEHPRVDIVAHPWWWRNKFTPACRVPIPFPWLEDFSIIPQSMHDEFAAATRENGKLVELNFTNILGESYSAWWHEQYLEYVVGLREAGCRFATGSDSHGPGYQPHPQDMLPVLERAGFTQADLWDGPDERPGPAAGDGARA